MSDKALTLPGSDTKFLDRPSAEPSVWGYNTGTWRFVFAPASGSAGLVIAGAGLNSNRGNGYDGWALFLSAGTLYWRLCSDPTNSFFGQNYTTGVSVGANELCDMIVTVNPSGSNVGFYRSGFNTQNASPGGMVAPSLPLVVGNWADPAAQGGGVAFNGKIYEVSAWNRILTNDEIRGLQCAGSHALLADPSPGPYYPDSAWKVSSGRTRLYTFNATPNDETAGAGTSGADLTEHGGPLDYSASNALFGIPQPAGAVQVPPTWTAAETALGEITVTWSKAVIPSDALRALAQYVLTPPGTALAIAIESIQIVDPTHARLILSGDLDSGGVYTLEILANTARADDDGSANVDASATVARTGVLLRVTKADDTPNRNPRVYFSKPVTMGNPTVSVDALNAANYTVVSKSSGATVAVNRVYRVDSKTVELDISNLSPGGYHVTVANVTDLAGNTFA